MPVEIVFSPAVETSYNYNLNCIVKRKSRPVCINVKGIGYILHHGVFLSGNNTALDSAAHHPIDFGNIYINEKRTRTIEIVNTGGFNFDYSMKKASSAAACIHLNPEMGTV